MPKLMSRRRFLFLTGGGLIAAAVTCGGSAYLLSPPPSEYAHSACVGSGNQARRCLITYASRCGSTGEIANFIGHVFCDSGVAVDVHPLSEIDDISPYTSVIIGSAVRMGKLLPETVTFAERHAAVLQNLPTAYFVACYTMHEDTSENRATALGYLDPLCTIREPISQGLFGGKIDYDTLARSTDGLFKSQRMGCQKEIGVIGNLFVHGQANFYPRSYKRGVMDRSWLNKSIHPDLICGGHGSDTYEDWVIPLRLIASTHSICVV